MFLFLSLYFLIVGVSSNYAFVERQLFYPRYRCGRHEHFVFNSEFCQVTCTNRIILGADSFCYPVTGCVCDYGYVRRNPDGSGPCISQDECPPDPIWCGPNEVATDCEIICPPQTCDSNGITYICDSDVKLCRKGCDCIPGYLRNGLGMCIPQSFCPRSFQYVHYHKYGPYLYPDLNSVTISSSPDMSSSPSVPNVISPTENGIKIEPTIPSCGDEQPSTAASSSSTVLVSHSKSLVSDSDTTSTPDTTSTTDTSSITYTTSTSSADDLSLTTIPNTAALADSSSVLLSQSASFHSSNSNSISNCPKPNEEWNPCPPTCLKEQCDEVVVDQSIECSEEDTCKPRCICIENYYRNASGICIHKDDCSYYEYV